MGKKTIGDYCKRRLADVVPNTHQSAEQVLID